MMRRLITIDPGASTGWALWVAPGDAPWPADGAWHLDEVGDQRGLRARLRELGARGPFVALVERPYIYPQGGTKNPNDVLQTALSAGAWFELARFAGGSSFYLPAQTWTDNRPKDQNHLIFLEKLRKHPQRLNIFAAYVGLHGRTRANHVLDAIGMGLWVLERGKHPEKLGLLTEHTRTEQKREEQKNAKIAGKTVVLTRPTGR